MIIAYLRGKQQDYCNRLCGILEEFFSLSLLHLEFTKAKESFRFESDNFDFLCSIFYKIFSSSLFCADAGG